MKKIKLSKRAKALLKKCGHGELLSAYEGKDFCEFIISEGGDVMTFRVYDDGRVYEK